ncbi:MAG: S-layer homology domain-containing protein [Oscillospiraceae bacterium]|nr:S-layer homology domain-containing protein [Oscillospiraceae bacterium]
MKTIGKLIALMLAVALCLSVVVLPTSAAEISKEDFEAVIVETAMAYYYKAMAVQYDSNGWTIQNKNDWGGACRLTSGAAPEEGSSDYTIYSVCSDWCYDVYYNAFGYKLMEIPRLCRTAKMMAVPASDKLVAFKYDPTGADPDAMKDIDTAITTARDGLQVGDIIVGYGSSGHAMLYIGDYKGDGTKYIIHCWGGKFEGSTGVDTIEDKVKNANPKGGAIRIDSVAEVFTEPDNTETGVWNLRKASSGSAGFTVLRPSATDAFKALDLTPAAKARLQYRGIQVDKETSVSRYSSTKTGDELKLTVKITNNGTAAYSGVTVTEPLPTGATLKDAGNGKEADGKITWTVDVPAGGSAEVGYTVTVTAKRGGFVSFASGTVGTLPTRATKVPVGGAKLPADVVDKAERLREGLTEINAEEYTSVDDPIDVVNKLYEQVFGIKLNLPLDLNAWIEGLCEQIAVGGVAEKYGGWMWQPKPQLTADWQFVKDMIIPEHLVGYAIYLDKSPDVPRDDWSANNRVQEYREDRYEIGDIFIALADPDVQTVRDQNNVLVFVYLGDGKVACKDTVDGIWIDDFSSTIGQIYNKNVTIGLRPTLAYDDIATGKIGSSLPFTDVAPGEWYFNYVKDLVNDGTVNGMSPTSYAPKGNLTYGQALKLITCALGYGEQAATDANWASGYLKLAQEKGWITGDVDLNGTITRLAFCQIAAKAAGLTEQPDSNPFTDTEDTEVLALNKAGVINGMTETTFEPNGLLTRAQIAKIIWVLRDVK